MVDALNHFGLDFATFGNHEFDLKEQQFHQRMAESKFTWISSNVSAADGQPFAGVEPSRVLTFTGARSDRVFRVGLFGVTAPVNQPPWVRYTDALAQAREQVSQLAGQADFIIALTHQTLDDDSTLLEHLPRIGLVLGGHEHVNFQYWRGNFSPLLKADANVRSVYVVDLWFDPRTGHTEVKPTFVPITDRLPENPAVKAVVDRWLTIAFRAFRQQGFEPTDRVTTTTEPLDGLESTVRTRSTALTELIARSMLRAYPQAELALYNSGSIRIDDVIPPGPITVYDVIRVLPFGGQVQLVTIKGSLLEKVLQQGAVNAGGGGFLQSANVRRVDERWQVGGVPIDPVRDYRLAVNDFLVSGREQNLEWLMPGPELRVVDPGADSDVRRLVIDELRRK